MSIVIETTLGDITVDLYLKERPRACLNFLKLCKIKYYNYNLFHTISRNFIAQTGDPTGSRSGGESIFGVLEGPLKRYFEAETAPRIKHTIAGLVSFVGNEEGMIGSQFFITLAPDLTYLDAQHCVFGEVVEGHEILELLNEVICDGDSRPYQDVRITHTVILDDPLPDPDGLKVPDRSPSPSAERLQGGRIAPDEEIDETAGKSMDEINEMIAEREAKARATILEMVGDIPDVDVAPPENVLFVCKLNPVTTDDDLEIIFSRFGKIKSCEVIRDRKTGDSLQYAFVEFEDQKACEDAYFKMDNVLIDDRRIHVDFSQSVAKVKWHGKGRGVTHFDDRGKKTDKGDRNIGKGNYRVSKNREGNGEHKPRSADDRRGYMRRREVESQTQRRNFDRRYREKSRSRSRDRRNTRDNEGTHDGKRYRRVNEKSSNRNRSRSRSREGRNRRYDEGRWNRRRDKSIDTYGRNKSRSRSKDRKDGKYYASRSSDGRNKKYEEPAVRSKTKKDRSSSLEIRKRSMKRDNFDKRPFSSKKEVSSESDGEQKSRKRIESVEKSKIRSKKQESSTESSKDESEIKSKTKADTKKRSGRRRDSTESSDSNDQKQKKRLKKKQKQDASSSSDSDSSSDNTKKKSRKRKKKRKQKHNDTDSD